MSRAAEAYGSQDSADFARQIIVTALRLLRDGAEESDVKLLNSALKELRHSFRVFAPYEHLRKVAVFGSARTQPDEPAWQQAFAFAERIAREGWMVITGAGSGIMAAAQGGAGREASFGVNIRLPFEQSGERGDRGRSQADQLPVLLHAQGGLREGVARDRAVSRRLRHPRRGLRGADADPDRQEPHHAGRLRRRSPGGSYWRDWQEWVRSHLAEQRLISERDLSLFRVTDDVDVAVHEILNFYSNYHSCRYVADRLVLRLRQAPNPEQLDALNRDFADLLGFRRDRGSAGRSRRKAASSRSTRA